MAKNAGADGLTPWHKIAVLMIALGQEGAGELMQYFGEDEVAQVA
jgi:flagellar motor switch protein FliG